MFKLASETPLPTLSFFPAPLHLTPSVHAVLHNLTCFSFSFSFPCLCLHSLGVHAALDSDKKENKQVQTSSPYILANRQEKISPLLSPHHSPHSFLGRIVLYQSLPEQINWENFRMSWARMVPDPSSAEHCISVYHSLLLHTCKIPSPHLNSPFFPCVPGLSHSLLCLPISFLLSLPHHLCHYIPTAHVSWRVGGKKGFN